MELFNMIKNEKNYCLVDQVKLTEDYKEACTKIMKDYEEEQIDYLSILMAEASGY
ncbi:hypothetical protein [Psychrobacillus sp. OK032]|uniref:hypothetical protein n=1 Tax=Psychrobacillus sp. OK032 TaxID=1884358 RepID=UPI0008ADD7C6|nr:hypothetical protein [Psychrobacillus sp. OK032]SES39643.1 hypothetical protein SAMN05518872_1109 [Psychrobacillus sp. OK032]